MQKWQENVLNTFGLQGMLWLDNLPQFLQKLQIQWHLSNIQPFPNLSYHFVARAFNEKNEPIVLKMGCDTKLIKQEAITLKVFDGIGAVRLLDEELDYGALLLEEVRPGAALKEKYPENAESVMETYSLIATQLQGHAPSPHFTQVEDWLETFDQPCYPEIPEEMFLKARELKTTLLATQKEIQVLHGDLHLENILSKENSWVCIDPKGLLGEAAFEMAAFNFLGDEEYPSPLLLHMRIEKLAGLQNISAKRLTCWAFVRLMLSAIWSIENKGDPGRALETAKALLPLSKL